MINSDLVEMRNEYGYDKRDQSALRIKPNNQLPRQQHEEVVCQQKLKIKVAHNRQHAKFDRHLKRLELSIVSKQCVAYYAVNGVIEEHEHDEEREVHKTVSQRVGDQIGFWIAFEQIERFNESDQDHEIALELNTIFHIQNRVQIVKIFFQLNEIAD